MQITPIFPPFPIDLAPFFNAILHPVLLWHSVLSSSSFMAFTFFLIFLSATLFVGIVVLTGKIDKINRKPAAVGNSLKGIRLENVKSKRFLVVEKHMASDNSAEWRLAVMEADALLEEMVKRMGYEGTTLGEMLKNIERSDFNTLDDAWEAHKIRNQIAHQGSSFLLTKREAKRVTQLYEKVFREFDII